MGLASAVKGAVAAAFGAVDEARTTATANTGQAGTYDPETDATVLSGGEARTVRGVKYRDLQTQGRDAPGTSASFVFQASEAPEGIDEADTIIIGGETWQISDVERDPLNATIILRLRK
jgi:hypothetical protein